MLNLVSVTTTDLYRTNVLGTAVLLLASIFEYGRTRFVRDNT
jgi:hypothetical protein